MRKSVKIKPTAANRQEVIDELILVLHRVGRPTIMNELGIRSSKLSLIIHHNKPIPQKLLDFLGYETTYKYEKKEVKNAGKKTTP